MTMTTPMPRASASVIPDHDSVEDFASPLKKFKVDKDLVGEDHTTDSAAVAASMELTEEEAFKIWCKVQRKEYPDNKEKQSRFEVFRSNLVKTPFTPTRGAYPCLADLTKDEFEEFCEKYKLQKYDRPVNNNISFEEIIYYRDYLLATCEMPEDKVENEKDFAKLEDSAGEEDNTRGSAAAAVMELTEEEAFKIWCKVQRKEYPDNKEKQSRFEVFRSNLVKTPFTPTRGAYPCLADLTKDEFEEFCEKYKLQKYDQPVNNNISFEEIIYYRDYLLATCEMPEDKDNTPFPTHLYQS